MHKNSQMTHCRQLRTPYRHTLFVIAHRLCRCITGSICQTLNDGSLQVLSTSRLNLAADCLSCVALDSLSYKWNISIKGAYRWSGGLRPLQPYNIDEDRTIGNAKQFFDINTFCIGNGNDVAMNYIKRKAMLVFADFIASVQIIPSIFLIKPLKFNTFSMSNVLLSNLVAKK